MAERTLAMEFERDFGAMRASSAKHEQVRQAATMEPEEPDFRLPAPHGAPSASGDSRSKHALPAQPESATDDGRVGARAAEAELEFEQAAAEHDRNAQGLRGGKRCR